MQWKKITFVIAATLLFLTVPVSCSSNPSKDTVANNSAETAVGRYIEKELNYPDDLSPEEHIENILISPEGNLELYTYRSGKDKFNYIITKYRKTGEEWLKENADGLNPSYYADNDVDYNLFYGEDGILYVTTIDTHFNRKLYQCNDDGKLKEIFNKSCESNSTTPLDPAVKIKILKNGMIAVLYVSGKIEIYSSDGKTKVYDFNCGPSLQVEADGNDFYYISLDDIELLAFNAEKALEGTSHLFDSKVNITDVVEVKNGTVYLYSKEGLQQKKDVGSLWETIIEGDNVGLYPEYIRAMGEGDYYLKMNDTITKETYISHVYYDEIVPSVPSTELTIYSLEDNDTIQHAIKVFEESNPDVLVTFRIAKRGSEAASTEDMIKALNTEIIAKKGADILILDGIPIEDYVEKGVLEDMGDIFLPRIESGELWENIAANYARDGKVYVMPVRFNVPIIYGCAGAVATAGSVEELAEYTKTSAKVPLFDWCSYRYLAKWMLLIDYNQIKDENNVFSKEKYIQFLESVNTIAKNIKARKEPLSYYWKPAGMEETWEDIGGVNIMKKAVQSNIVELKGIADLVIPLITVEDWKGSYSTISNTYIPKTFVGINSSSKQKELAKEFIKLLFSDELQQKMLEDGFPISQTALNYWLDYQKDGIFLYYFKNPFNAKTPSSAYYPDRANRAEFFEKLYSLTTPAENDQTIETMILDETERYLLGNITAKEAAQNVGNHIETYLAE